MKFFARAFFFLGLIVATNICAAPAAENKSVVSEVDLLVGEVQTESSSNASSMSGEVDQMDLILQESIKQPEALSALQVKVGDVAGEENLAGEVLADQLDDLEEKSSAMQAEMTKLVERIKLLEENVAKLNEVKKENTGSFYSKFRSYFDGIKAQLGNRVFTTAIAIIILAFLAFLIYLMVPRRRKASCNVSYPQGNAMRKESDVDFPAPMGEIEGADTKINLARAYIEMGEIDKAKPILQSVLLHGNDHDQDEAKALLDKIRSHSL